MAVYVNIDPLISAGRCCCTLKTSNSKAGRTLELPAQQDVIRALEFSRKPQCAVSILELLPHSRLLAQIFNVLNNFRYE